MQYIINFMTTVTANVYKQQKHLSWWPNWSSIADFQLFLTVSRCFVSRDFHFRFLPYSLFINKFETHLILNVITNIIVANINIQQQHLYERWNRSMIAEFQLFLVSIDIHFRFRTAILYHCLSQYIYKRIGNTINLKYYYKYHLSQLQLQQF